MRDLCQSAASLGLGQSDGARTGSGSGADPSALSNQLQPL